MRRKAWGAVTALACVAVAAGAGSVLAGESDEGPGQTPDPTEMRKVTAEVVSAPGTVNAKVLGTAARRAKTRKPQLVYLETAPQTLAAGPTGFRIGDCPRRSVAINGYYYINEVETAFGLDNQGDFPIRRLKQWGFYLDSPSGASNVTFGVVCLKNVEVR